MEFEDVHRFQNRLYLARQALRIAREYDVNDARIAEKEAEYKSALAAFSPFVDLIGPGECIAFYDFVIMKLDIGGAVIVPARTYHDLADRYNAANPAPAPAADPIIEHVPPQYAGEPEYVDNFHE
jgi:hypothetical protein